MNCQTLWDTWDGAADFTGLFSVRDENGIVFEQCKGLRNIAEELPIRPDTAFAVASGTKLFTALAILKLVEAGKLSIEDRIWDVLKQDLGEISKQVTLRHLLTHSSGIGDYLDEEADDYEETSEALARRYPVYLWETLSYYLQMITPLPMKFTPGERFGYCNAGYILLGLAVEAVSGKPYQQFVQEELIAPLSLTHTGFYRADNLPGNTALDYMEDGKGGQKTNIYTLPVIGGADGGIYTCAQDMDILWRALFAGRIITGETLEAMLRAQIHRGGDKSYGLGVYRIDRNGRTAWYAIGADAGVHFFSLYVPQDRLTISAFNNTEYIIFSLLDPLFTEALG